ncbi:unnamed protein product [Penicillium nalgiovense]|nr:unnamed protein product [Penicillium nalgiovense]
MTGDIIKKYAYGNDFGYLEADDYKTKWKTAVSGSLKAGMFFRHFPFLDFYMFLPSRLAQVVSPGIGEILFIEDLIRKQVERLLSSPIKEAKAENTIFDALLDPAVPAEEKTVVIKGICCCCNRDHCQQADYHRIPLAEEPPCADRLAGRAKSRHAGFG